MDLGATVAAERTDEFHALQSDGTFKHWTRGRLAPVDRFLSNFHKPLQRRHLFTDPSVPYPPLRTIKQVSTGEVFLLGQYRTDVEDGKSFDRLSVLHNVSSVASGYVEYFNYISDNYDPLNIVDDGIGKTSEGFFYLSVEYVSTRQTALSDEAYQGKLLVYGADDAPLKENGVFTLHGLPYKVIETYKDSGFTCGVLLQHSDDMEMITYEAIDEAQSGYDVATGVKTLTTYDVGFAGTVDKTRKADDGHTMYDVYLKYDKPYPVVIEIDNHIRRTSGDRLTIVSVDQDKNAEGQLKLVCVG